MIVHMDENIYVFVTMSNFKVLTLIDLKAKNYYTHNKKYIWKQMYIFIEAYVFMENGITVRGGSIKIACV